MNKRVEMKRPHVVILGAGASRAAFPKGDLNGNRLPLMTDFVEIIGLDGILNNIGISYKGKNFEAIYSELHSNKNHLDVINKIDSTIYSYFDKLKIPNTSTIYDHLILSLTSNDLIATFNWDPLLSQAYIRHLYSELELPEVVLLHGSVAMGSCEKCFVQGPKNSVCYRCNSPFTPHKILYPITNKNYTNKDHIHTEWNKLNRYLKSAYMVTIFGYSAPKEDVEAKKAMKEAWGEKHQRQYEEFELITDPKCTKSEKKKEVVRKSWDEFILEHHYGVHGCFYNSWLARHPRRSCQAFWDQSMELCWDTSPAKIPLDMSLEKLSEWFKEAEKRVSVYPTYN